jgi:tungstate transport system substrate-binding protein
VSLATRSVLATGTLSRAEVVMRRRTVVASLACLVAGLVAGVGTGCGRDDRPRVRLATTTSPRDSGLLDWLLPEIERRTGMRVSVIAVGTGQVLELARRGDADLVLVHDRAREDAFVRDGHGVDRRDVMWNDFVVLGPPEDPARLAGGEDAVAAFRAIARSRAPFVSRGDSSGTHARETSLWAKAGTKPAWSGYVETGQGQGPTLLAASEKKAYVLTDRGTFASMRKRLGLKVVVEGDPALRNPYGAIVVSSAKSPSVDESGARAVLDYLTSAEGQARIGAFRVDGEALFHPGAGPPGG